MDASPNELKVLESLVRAWVRKGTWGVDVYGVHYQVCHVDIHDGGPLWADEQWQPSESTVRQHLKRLEIKGHVRSAIRPSDGCRWWAPTDAGRLELLERMPGGGAFTQRRYK
jgi:cytochrome c5